MAKPEIQHSASSAVYVATHSTRATSDAGRGMKGEQGLGIHKLMGWETTFPAAVGRCTCNVSKAIASPEDRSRAQDAPEAHRGSAQLTIRLWRLREKIRMR